MKKFFDSKAFVFLLGLIVGALLILSVCAATFIIYNIVDGGIELPDFSKKYKSTAQIYISYTQDTEAISSDYESGSLTKTYGIILQSEKAKQMLRESLKGNEEYARCEDKTSYSISVSPRTDSEILQIEVISRDPELSAIVCNTMIDVSKALIEEVFEGSAQVHPLGEARANYTPVKNY